MSRIGRVVVSGISNFTTSDPSTLVVDPDHVHPRYKLYNVYGIAPETIPEVYTCGFLETTRYIRCFFKEADILLRVGGLLIVHYFRDSIRNLHLRYRDFTMNELSLALGHRYEMIDKSSGTPFTRYIFEKVSPTLLAGDTIDRWSFGIIFDGSKNDKIIQTVDEINLLGIPECEVLICGPSPGDNLPENVTVLEDVPADRVGRGPISAKKNRLIKAARYNNLVLIHDRIGFRPNWYRAMRDYGNYFEVLSTRVEAIDEPSRRVNDWRFMEGSFADIEQLKDGYLSHEEWRPSVYLNGGYIVAKKHIIESVLFDERLSWAECEDIHLSRRLYMDGVLIAINPKASATSLTYRLKGYVPIEDSAPSLLRKIYRRTGILRLLVNLVRQQKTQQERETALMIFRQQVEHQTRTHSLESVKSIETIPD